MKKPSSLSVAFLQALGLTFYCSLVGLLMWKANSLFGKIDSLLGPTLFLVLFVVSAMICALISLGYPFLVFWDKKNTKEALKIVVLTALWLLVFTLLIVSLLIIF